MIAIMPAEEALHPDGSAVLLDVREQWEYNLFRDRHITRILLTKVHYGRTARR
jgi:hypothetical protein